MSEQPTVIIVGGGIGGLILGGILEKAHVEYLIIEKQPKDHRIPGIGMTLKPAIMPLFQQLGIFDKLIGATKPFASIELLDQNLVDIGTFATNVDDFDLKERYDYYSRVITRPALFEILRPLVPEHKIHYNKSVQSIVETTSGVTVHLEDETTPLTGTIVVGADGAHSIVRSSIYKHLNRNLANPVPVEYGFDCVAGVSEVVEKSAYPVLEKDEFSRFKLVKDVATGTTVWYIPLKDRFSWFVVKPKQQSLVSKNSTWDLNQTNEFVKQARDIKNPYGATFGEVLDRTKHDHISKTVLEEKFFEHWFQGRSVLIGDAAHSTDPLGGQGAMATILDSISLGNILHDLKSNSSKDIETAFKAYHLERSELARGCVEYSRKASSLILDQGYVAEAKRYAVLRLLPAWVIRNAADKLNAHYPQLNFLPQVPRSGIFRPTEPVTVNAV